MKTGATSSKVHEPLGNIFSRAWAGRDADEEDDEDEEGRRAAGFQHRSVHVTRVVEYFHERNESRCCTIADIQRTS